MVRHLPGFRRRQTADGAALPSLRSVKNETSIEREGDLMRRNACLVLLASILLARDGQCYVDSSPTLGGICYAAGDILVVRVKQVSRERRVIVYEGVRAIKGRAPKGFIRHSLPLKADQRTVAALL